MNLDLITVFIASAILLVLLVVLVVVFVLFYQKKLLAQKIHLQHTAHQHKLDLLKATIETQEREQLRLGKDLHDDVGALLTATKLQVQQIERHIEGNAQAAPHLALTNQMLAESIAHVRAVARNLVPPTLEHFGLTDAVTDMAARFSNSGVLLVSVSSQASTTRFEPSTELALYRMAQEMVNNTVKHANATEAVIRLTATNDLLTLHYADNGNGFDPHSSEPGVGLKSLESRSDMIGAALTLQNTRTGGFEAIVSVPLPKTATPANHERNHQRSTR